MITLQTKDKSFQVTKEELESVTVDEWFLSLQLKYLNKDDEDNIVKIDEEYEIFKDIYDSFKFRTLIITNINKIKYYQKLGEKWIFPDWLQEEIQEKIFEVDKFREIKKHLLEIEICKNCHQGFKIQDNHESACHFHPGPKNGITFTCCGFKNSDNGPLEYYCRKGYHVVDKIKTLDNLAKYKSIFQNS